MNNTLHTPGPFPLRVTKNDDHFVIVTNQETHYAKTFDASAAHLIASAPDLISTLEEICAMIVSPNDTRADILAHATKAIRKAKGEV